MTAQDLLSASLRIIGVLASGESLAASEATDGLNLLNDFIDLLSTQNMIIPNRTREVFPFVVNQQTYTMGTGGNFSTSRPMEITSALIQLTGSSPVLELPMKILNQDQYAGIILKGVTSTYPLFLYSDNAYPLTNISVFPVPNVGGNNLVLYSLKPLTDIATLTTVLSFPPGYQMMLRYNLAVMLASEYGKQLSQEVTTIAAEAMAAVKRRNFQVKYLRVDDAILAKPPVFNWYTGEPQ